MLLSSRLASLFPYRNSSRSSRSPRRAARAVVEHIESRLLLSAVPIVSGQTIAGNIGHAGQVDTYTFSAAVGNTFEVTLGDSDATSNVHPYLQILAPGGARVVNNAQTVTKTSTSGIVVVPANLGGTYTILVQDYYGNNTGGYDVELAKAPSSQHADSNGDGGVILSGQTKAGTINRYGDIDVFTFTANVGNSFDISLGDASASSTMRPYLQVFTPAGTRVVNVAQTVSNTSVSGIYTVPAGAGGTFTAIVQDYYGNATGGAYDVELAVAPATQAADSNGDGGPIVKTQTIAGNINRTGDIDTYTFSATAGDNFQVTFADASPASGVRPYLQIFNPAGVRITNAAQTVNNTSEQGNYAVPVGGTGTYTIVVQDYYGNGTGAYNLELTGNIHSVGAQILLTAPSVAQTAAATAATSIKLGSFTATNATSPFKATINWGDGTANTVVNVNSPGTIPATSHTFPKAGTDTITEYVTDAKSNKSNTITFKVTVSAALATIGGRVFGDTNANGLVDKGELGLGLYTVYIDKNNDGVFNTGDVKTTTDVSGNWSFTGLAAGKYVIRVVQIAGSAATKPTGGVLTLTVTAGQVSTGNLFGEHGV